MANMPFICSAFHVVCYSDYSLILILCGVVLVPRKGASSLLLPLGLSSVQQETARSTG